MTVRKLSFALLFGLVSIALNAQDAAPAPYRSFTPKDQWELGIHAGLPILTGDLDGQIGFGGGLHIRKALDHIFSIRVSALYAQGKGEGGSGANDARTADLTWINGSAQIVATLNNFRFNKPFRKLTLNGFAGLGVSSWKSEFKNIINVADGSVDDFNPNVEIGGGLNYRINSKFNIGLEYTVYSLFGKNADLLDGDENVTQQRTTYRDNLHYPHLTFCINLGGKNADGSKKSEPLYWVNAMGQVSDAITALEARPVYDPTDTDKDGIIDAIDEEDNSPEGARVDTRGVTLDSDGDKVADYKDKEPFSTPFFTKNGEGVAQVPKPITEEDVNRIVDAKLANFKLPVQPGISNWFLPIVNFDDNRYDIRYSEYEKLYQIAQVMKQNPDLKVVAVGGADARSSEPYNNVLSFNRAKAAVDFLVAQHGIARERLIVNYVGETSPMVPVNGANLQNRRVEFRVAKGETEMARPEGPEAGKSKGSFKGNKDAGY